MPVKPNPSSRDGERFLTLLTERFWPIFAVVVTLLLGTLVAFWIGSGEMRLVSMVAAVATLGLVVLGLQQRAWAIILMGWTLTGQILLLPIPFSVRDLAIGLAMGAYIAHRIVYASHVRVGWNALTLLIGVNYLWLGVTFAVNPVGFRAMGAETMGARPYLNAMFALMAYWVITRLPSSDRAVRWGPVYVLVGAAVVALLQAITYIAPSSSPYLYTFYSSLNLESYYAAGVLTADMVRLKGLAPFGMLLVLTLVAYKSPRELLNPFRPWFYALLVAFGCILASGFRGVLLQAFVAIVLSAWLYRDWRDLAFAGTLGAVLLIVVIGGQGQIYELPTVAQRSLSFLPGKWSETVVIDAEASTTSRFKWWEIIAREGVIRNWWTGDGFGLRQSDFQTMGRSTFEDVLVTGAYHNGPLTTIRFAGIIGLALFYILSIAGAISAYACVRKTAGTLVQPLAIFTSIQLIWWPIHYTFVFGSYDVDFSELIFLLALLGLASRMGAGESVPQTAGPASKRALVSA